MCIFCKIVDKEIPSLKIYETDKIVAFLDIQPATAGHTLVVPKNHYDHILNLDDEIAGELMKTVVHVTKLLRDKLGVVNFNLENNNGILAGQEVGHYHVHIIPRYTKKVMTPQNKNITMDELRTIHQKIIS